MNARLLAAARAQFTRSLDTPCTIVRGATATVPGTTVGTSTCRIADNKNNARLDGEPRYEGLRSYKLTMPYDAAVLLYDQIVTGFGRYTITVPITPTSDQICVYMECYELYDVLGNPIYLKPNATITTMRQEGSVIATVLLDHPVRIEMPTAEIQTTGGLSAQGRLYALPGTDLVADDLMIITSLSGHTTSDLDQLADIRLQGVHHQPGALPDTMAIWRGREQT